MSRPWTTTEKRRLFELRAQRVPTRKIAEEFGRTEDAIYNFLRYVPATRDSHATIKRIDPLPRKQKQVSEPNPREWTEAELATMREMAEDGATARDVAFALGRSRSAVFSKACNLKIKFNNTGNHTVYRMDQQERAFKRNAIEGSAMLRDAILETFRPRYSQDDARETLGGETEGARIAA